MKNLLLVLAGILSLAGVAQAVIPGLPLIPGTNLDQIYQDPQGNMTFVDASTGPVKLSQFAQGAQGAPGTPGTSVYPASATASFPFGESASTITANSITASTVTATFISVSTITASSGTFTALNGGAISGTSLTLNGPGDGGLGFTIGISTYGVLSSSSQITTGHLLCSGSTNYTAVDCGTPGAAGGTPGGSAFQVQYSSANGTQFAGSPNFTNNGSTVTFSGVYAITETNVSTKTYNGVYFDYTGSTQAVTRMIFLDHAVSSGTTPTVNVVGGTTPTLDPTSTDMVGRFTWSGTATAATITFSKPWLASPFCVAVSTSSGLGTSAWGVASSTFTFSGLIGSTVTYHCNGGKGG